MIWNHLDKYRDLGILLLRGLAGLYMAFGHGLGKITAGPESWANLGGAMSHLGITFLPTFWGFMAAIAEFVCALLIVAGLVTRPAAILLVINMTVAANMHIQTGNGSPETAIMYGIVFLTLIFIGPGKYSLDAQFGSAR
jgi:putative oxidoreductase